jgi:predicted PurR-regulated permease PerM
MAADDEGRPENAVGVAPSGHNRLIGQPHDEAAEGPIAEAEAAAARMLSGEHPLGLPGRPVDRRSPFVVAVVATVGVVLTYGVLQLIGAAAQVLVLLAFALFLAIGLEPAVSWLVNHRWRRGVAVTAVLLTVFGVVAGFLAMAVPPLVTQIGNLVANIPDLVRRIQDNSDVIGRLSRQLDLEQNVQRLLSEAGPALAGGVLGVGIKILSGIGSLVVVLAFTAYLLSDMPRLRRTFYRMFPAARRPRAILIGDQIFVRVGAYVLGNLAISAVAGLVTFVWLLIFDVPYPLLLAAFVALTDLIPVVGATLGGIGVALVSLTVSWPVGLATLGFYVVYQSIEGYVLIPPIIGRAVRVPAVLTAAAVLLGGAMLGLFGALVAVPVAAGVVLVVQQVVYPALDRR